MTDYAEILAQRVRIRMEDQVKELAEQLAFDLLIERGFDCTQFGFSCQVADLANQITIATN